MSPALSIAASLSPDILRNIGIQVISRSQPISRMSFDDFLKLTDGEGNHDQAYLVYGPDYCEIGP